MMSKKWKKVWIAAACVVLLIFLGMLLLHSRFIKQKILSSLQLSLQESQGIHVAVESFDYNLLKLQFVLKGIQLQKLDKSSLPPVFRAEEIKVNIPLSLLLRHRLRIQEIEIINPEIHLLIDRCGNSNIPFQTGAKQSPGTQTIPNFLIEHFEVKNAQINFIDKGKGLELGLSEVWIKGDGQNFGMHSFLLEMQRAGVVNFRNRSYPLERCIVQAELERRGLNIEKLFFALANSEIELRGRFGDFSSLSFSGSMQGHFDVGDLRSLTAADNPFSGNIEFRSNLKGPIKELEAQIVMKSEDLSYGNIENIGMSAELSWKDKAVEILSIDLWKEKGEIHGQGTLHPLEWDEDNHLNLEWKNLDTEPFMDFIQSPYLLSARTSGSLKVSWDGFSFDDISGECDIRFTPNEMREDPAKGLPLNGRIVAKADSGRLDITLQDISLLDSDLKGKFHLSSDELSGDFGLEVQSVGKMIPLILTYARNLDEKDVQRLGLDGPVSVSGTLGGNLKEPSVRFNLKSANFQILKTKNLRIEGSVLYDLRSLHIEPLLIEDGVGRIEIAGIYPLYPAGRAMRIDIEGEALSVEKILEIFGSEPKAKGFIQSKAKIEGTADAPRVESKWVVSGASLYEESIGRIEVEANYQNGKIIIDSLHVTESTGALEASGFYDLESNEFRARLSGKSFPLDGLKLAENIDRIKAELDIDFEAYGNFDDLHLKTKGKIHQILIGTQFLSELGFEAQSEQDEIKFKLAAPVFASSVDGTVSLNRPFVLNADLSIDQMHLEGLKDRILLFKKHDFSGLVTAEAHVSVDLRDPKKTLSCEARIEQAHLKSGDRQIRNDGPILLSFGAETLRAEKLLLVGTGIRIKAEGSLPLNIPSSSKLLLSAEVDLSLLNDFLPIKDCQGSLKIESQFLGSLSDLDVAAVLDLSDTQFQSSQFSLAVEDIQAHFEIDKNLLRVDSFSGQIAQSRFELKGELPLASLPFQLPAEFHVFEEKKVKLVLDFANWDPSSLRDLVADQMFQNLRGTISGRIELDGKSLRPEDIAAKGFFKAFELDISGVSFKQDAPSQISLEGGVISIGIFSLRNGENNLKISGTAGLTGGEDLDLSLDGELDMSLLSIFLLEGDFSGKTLFQIKITHSYEDPEIQGFLDIQDGRYQRILPRLLLEQVNGRIEFKRDQVEIENIQGLLNGGKLILSGKIGLDGMTILDTEIVLKDENSLFDYPNGLDSHVSGELKFLSDGKVHQMVGTITILDARYGDDFRVGTAVFNLLKRGSVRETLREPNPFLKNLSLDINVGIANDFIIDNNIAKAEVSADLKLIGTPYNPSLSGRASVAEGGEVYFNQNTFSIEQGTVDFINPIRIEPDLNLNARTQVQEYDIRLSVQGTPDNLTANLVSDPPLAEPNIISLLVMGRTLDSASAHVLSAAGSTALSYLNNAITGRVEQATARALGLESVRIDAGLVSTEENPEARITVGQHLTHDIELVFSQDLKDTRNQMWMLNYNPHKSFNIQGVRRDNNEFNLALRHEIQFGLKPIPQQDPSDKREKKNLIVGDIQLEGRMSLPDSKIFQSLKLKKGRKIGFARLHDALERIRKLYRKNNYLGFSLAARREESNGRLDIILQIDSGSQIYLEFEGTPIPKKLKREMVDTWVGSPFGQLAREDIEQRVRVHFMEKRYYEVKVRSEERKGEKGERYLVFQTEKGRRYGKPDIQVNGNRAISEKVLVSHLEKSGVMNSVFFKPAGWVKSIEDLYVSHGYLRPKVQLPVVHLERDEKKADIDVSIDEGTRFKVENVELKGIKFIKDNQILDEIGIRSGNIVSPEQFNQIDHNIYELYVQKGFNDVRVQSDVQVNTDKGTVDLNIDVKENQRGIVAEIRIEGNKLTSEKIIRRELMFSAGDVLNFRMINETRKRLYDLGVFERVNIDITPLVYDDKNPVDESKDSTKDEKYFRVVINVRELKPYRLRYGFQYDTESSFGVLANLVNRNFLGKADLMGTSFRLNRDERDARAFFRSPYFFGKNLNTELFLFYNRIIKPAFSLDRTGFTLQQQMKIKKSNVISYNYTFEKIDTLYPVFEGVQSVDTTDRIGTLNVAFSRDTRNDILNATRGMFLSQSIRYAPGFLGSNAQFIRYFGQYNTYQRLSGILTYAVSIRIGLGKGLNGDLPTSERFFAGGGTTIRGFKKDEIGPKDPLTGSPLGGDTAFILNQEIRFPIFKKFGGVVFLDMGNVYTKISDFDFSDLRKTAGFGFRLHTPFILVRFDWGFKLDRRPGETLSQIFFSIGQAF